MDASHIDTLLSLLERRRAEGQPLTDEELDARCRQYQVDPAEVRRRLASAAAAAEAVVTVDLRRTPSAPSPDAPSVEVSQDGTVDHQPTRRRALPRVTGRRTCRQ